MVYINLAFACVFALCTVSLAFVLFNIYADVELRKAEYKLEYELAQPTEVQIKLRQSSSSQSSFIDYK